VTTDRSRLGLLFVAILSFGLLVLFACQEPLDLGVDSVLDLQVAGGELSGVTPKVSAQVGLVPPAPEAQSTLTIVYTNNIDGEIEPCG
tara:strand:- start:1232 stop:1495 length:264 start_codon:yes stop_codon:yes gene_type:complete